MATEFFDRPIFVSNEQTDNKKIENDIVKNILNDENIEFLIDSDHMSLPNTAEEIKQQSIDDRTKKELKKNERDIETLENLTHDTKRDLIKTFTGGSDGVIVDYIINVNDWVNKADYKKLDQDV